MVVRPRRGPDPRDPLLRWTALPLGLQVAFLASGTLALGLVADGARGDLLPLWPPAGLVCVALLAAPLRRWPALLAGMLAGAIAFAAVAGAPAALVVATALQAPVGAALTWALVGERRRPDIAYLRDVWAALAGAALAGPAAGGLAAGATLALAGDGAPASGALTLAMAAATGVLAVAPVLLAIPSDGSRPVRRPLEGASCLILAVLVPLLVMRVSDLPLSWLIALPPLWAALRLGPFGVAAATALAGVAACAMTLRGQGQYAAAAPDPRDALLLAQAFAALLVTIGATLAAVIAERARAAEQLVRAQKREGIGRLAGAVAHDFNNLLTIIGGHGALALEKAARGEDVSDELRRMVEAGDKAAVLTRQMLALSRRRPERREPVAVNDAVAAVVPAAGVAVETALDPRAGRVDCGADRLEQVLLNLVVNAREAMPEGGRLRIATERLSAGWVRIAVADGGPGMDEATRIRAFDPFFTTKPGASGLGLATVQGIVDQCGGEVELRSAPGAGTTVQIDLPRAAAPAPAPAPAVLPAGGGATVLVADDEPSLRALVRVALAGEGITVLEAGDGEEALAVAAAHGGAIDLLVTDIVMPRMSGPELAARLGVPVLYMSGYAEPDVTPAAELDEANFVAKPFSPLELARRVRERLDRPAPPPRGAATATPPRPRS